MQECTALVCITGHRLELFYFFFSFCTATSALSDRDAVNAGSRQSRVTTGRRSKKEEEKVISFLPKKNRNERRLSSKLIQFLFFFFPYRPVMMYGRGRSSTFAYSNSLFFLFGGIEWVGILLFHGLSC